MGEVQDFLLFSIENQRFVIPLSQVEKIVRAVEIVPLPKAPDVVDGIINVQGRILPVVNLRKRFDLSVRPLDVRDHFIVCNTTKRTLAILVDVVMDIVQIPEERIVDQKKIVEKAKYIKGALKLEDGVVLIQDLENLLSLEEEQMLENALEKKEAKRKRSVHSTREEV